MKYYVYIFIFLLTASCSNKEAAKPDGEDTDGGRKVTLELVLDTRDYTVPVTKNEFLLTEPVVLVFDESGNFLEAAQSFGGIVQLAERHYNCRIVLLSNIFTHIIYGPEGEDIFSVERISDYLRGKTINELQDLHTPDLPDPLHEHPYGIVESDEYNPRYLGYVPFSAITDAMPIRQGAQIGDVINPFELKRSVAKILVRNYANRSVSSTWQNPRFELLMAAAVNVSCRTPLINLTPSTLQVSHPLTNYIPLLPEAQPDFGFTGMKTITQNSNGVDLTIPYEVSNPIAVYETRKEDYPSVIIKGRYTETGKEYYYKLNIVRKENGSDVFMDVLRNHAYIISIESANGPGYDTFEEALNGKPVNLEYSILIQDISLHEFMTFEQDYYLAVSHSELYIYDYYDDPNDGYSPEDNDTSYPSTDSLSFISAVTNYDSYGYQGNAGLINEIVAPAEICVSKTSLDITGSEDLQIIQFSDISEYGITYESRIRLLTLEKSIYVTRYPKLNGSIHHLNPGQLFLMAEVDEQSFGKVQVSSQTDEYGNPTNFQDYSKSFETNGSPLYVQFSSSHIPVVIHSARFDENGTLRKVKFVVNNEMIPAR